MHIDPFELDLEVLQTLYKTYPDNEGIGIALAVKYREARLSEKAIEELDELEKKGVSGVRIDYEYGMALWELDRVEEAKERLYRAVASGQANATLYYNLANMERLGGNDEASMKLIDKGLELDPGHAFCRFGKGALLAGQGKFEESNEYLESALSEPGVRHEALEKLAFNALDMNDLNKAIHYAQLIQERDPNDAGAAFLLGVVAREREEWDIAAEWFEAAIEEAGEIAIFCYPMADVETERGNIDSAIEWCLKTIKSDPAFEGTGVLLASLYERKGDVESAVKWLNHQLSYYPDDGEAREMLVRLRQSN